jgi:hypothetical protein
MAFVWDSNVVFSFQNLKLTNASGRPLMQRDTT